MRLPLALTLATLLFAGCEPSARALRWELSLRDAEREARLVTWEGWISAGECDLAGRGPLLGDAGARDAAGLDGGPSVAPLYHARWAEGAAPPTPPVLPRGRYAFAIVGRDADCRPVVAGCEAVTLPTGADSVVRVDLMAADGPACASCTGGGCRGESPPASLRLCASFHELSCEDGDDDCDRVADCLDTECAGFSGCMCARDEECGLCSACDAARGACVATAEGVACAGPADAVGQCTGRTCCTGCRIDGACVPGLGTDACGADGASCTPCACPRADTCTAGACIDRDDATAIALGDGYGCALDGSGRIHCFGDNAAGRLGLNDTIAREQPEVVFCPGSTSSRCADWSAVRVGYSHSCAIRISSSAARLACWGANDHGQLGRGPVGVGLVPSYVAGTLRTSQDWRIVDADVGDGFTCAIARDAGAAPGTLFCWGDPSDGRLGAATVRDNDVPFLVPMGAMPPSFVQVALGRAHACVLDDTGRVRCWGANDHGQLGLGVAAPSSVPTPSAIPGTWSAIAAGGDHTCGVRLVGTPADRPRIDCWGRNDSGQLGVGDTTDRVEPTYLMTLGTGAAGATRELALGVAHTCTRTTTGRVDCFGDDSAMQIGAGGLDTRVPVAVGTGTNWSAIGAGGGTTCMVGERGDLWCAGAGGMGRLGRPVSDASEPMARSCLGAP